MKSTRDKVFEAINEERAYQDSKWNSSTTSTAGRHDVVTEWLVYMRDYVEEALHVMSRTAEPDCTEFAMHTVRKVTTLGVACMEQIGVRRRVTEGPRPIPTVKELTR